MTENNLSGRKPCACIINLIIFLAIIGAGVAVLSYFLLGTPNPEGFFVPHDPSSPGNWTKWDATDGLQLSIVNALDEQWYDIFYEYVDAWDQSDSLTLTTREVAADSSCEGILGELKVCNGDYGQTDWKGINLNLMQNEYIVQGTSQMNDFFLADASLDERKYTMCHEVGHGFGLPHTDENYYNANLGNCLDYTTFPESNLNPGDYNFKLLNKIYGTFPPTRRILEEVPFDVMEKFRSISVQMAGSDYPCKDGICEEEIGDGYRVVAHKLLV